jgi:hypothetical protein
VDKHSTTGVLNDEFALQAGLVRSSFLPGRRVRTELLEFPQCRAMLIDRLDRSTGSFSHDLPFLYEQLKGAFR